MKNWKYFRTICSVIILIGALVVSMNAIAQTPKQMTALEKKLYEGALKEGKLEWWDSLSLKESAEFIKEFNRLYPGIKVDYFEATSAVRDEKYLAEFAAGRKTLDYTSTDEYKRYKEKGLLADISDIAKDANFPLEFCSKDFLSASVEHSILGTAYNTKLVSPKDVPRTFEDLLDPKWKGKKISWEQRATLFIYLTPRLGREWMLNYLKRLKEQDLVFTLGHSQSLSLLATGEFSFVVGTIFHNTTKMRLKGAPVDWAPIKIAPDKLSPFVVMRHAPHPNAAKLFLRWLMTPEGQIFDDKIYLKGNPKPGSGTIQSENVAKYGLEVIPVSVAELADEFDELEKIYLEAVGFKKK